MAQREEISVEKLEQELDAFLSVKATKSGGEVTQPGCNLVHGNACVLATCFGNEPRATPVDFFTRGAWRFGSSPSRGANCPIFSAIPMSRWPCTTRSITASNR